MANKLSVLLLMGIFLTSLVGGTRTPGDLMTCERKYLITAAVTLEGNGTQVFFWTSGPHNNFTLDIAQAILPIRECGTNFRLCNILLLERDETTLLMFLPSQGGFLQITYPLGDKPLHRFVAVESDCNPVKSFYNDIHQRVLFECINYTSASLYILEYHMSQGTIRLSTKIPFLRLIRLSEAVYARSNIVFADHDHLLQADSRVSGSLTPQFVTVMGNCSQVNQVDVYNEQVYLYCSSTHSWTLPARNLQTFQLPYHLYPCPQSDMNVHLAGNLLILVNTTNSMDSRVTSLNNNHLTYGACVGLGEKLSFWGLTEDGQLINIPLHTRGQSMTNLTVCPSDGICLRPSLDPSKTAGAYFSHETNQIHIQNLTSSCGDDSIDSPFVPQLLAFSIGKSLDNCSCAELPTEDASVPGWITALIVLGVAGAIILTAIVVVLILLCVYRDSVRRNYTKWRCHCCIQSQDRHPLDNLSETGSISLQDNPPSSSNPYTYEEADEVLPSPVDGSKDVRDDVAVGRDISHTREKFAPQSVAENFDSRHRGEENENEDIEIQQHLRH